MPTICRFHGVVIRMFINDHRPSHFHVSYGGRDGRVVISELLFEENTLPRRIERLVLRWAQLHQNELVSNWERLEHAELPLPIEPLE